MADDDPYEEPKKPEWEKVKWHGSAQREEDEKEESCYGELSRERCGLRPWLFRAATGRVSHLASMRRSR